MKQAKKVTSLLLSVMFLLSAFVFTTAFAEETTEGTTEETTPAVVRTEFTDAGATIQFEDFIDDFAAVGGEKLTSSTTEGVTFVGIDTGSATESFFFNRPITVTKSGYYSLDLMASAYSKFILYVDGNTAPAFHSGIKGGTSTDTVVNEIWQYFGKKYHQAYNFNGKIYLTAGEHDLKLELTLRDAEPIKDTAGNTTGYVKDICSSMDYMKFTYNAEADKIAAEGKTQLEMDKFAYSFIVPISDGSYASAYTSTGGYLSTNKSHFAVDTSDTVLPKNTTEKFTVHFNVEKSDIYNVELMSTGYWSIKSIKLDNNFTFATNDNTSYFKKTSVGMYFLEQSWAGGLKTAGLLALAEGEHSITFEMTNQNRGSKDYAEYIDYISFEPAVLEQAEPRDIATDAATRIEFEDYYKYARVAQKDGTIYTATTAKGGLCSGTDNKYLCVDSTGVAVNPYETLTVPINITKAGTYNVNYVVTNNYGTKLFVDTLEGTPVSNGFTYKDIKDSEVVYKNDGVTKDYDKYLYFGSRWSWGREFGGTITFDTAGEHELLFRMPRRSAYNDVAEYLDYVELAPVSTLTEDGATVAATVDFGEKVTGKAILALYNGEELVDVADVDVDNRFATVTIADFAGGTVTSAKVMAWQDTTSTYAPLVKPVSFTKTNGVWTLN